MCKKTIFFTMLLLFVLVLSAAATDLAAGVKAYKSGDFKTALVVFQGLAAKGNAEAQTYLGEMYSRGEEVSIDFDEATAWYKKGAEGGDTRGQYLLSIAYSLGMGIDQNPALADKWLRMAADKGLPEAQNTLGLAYFEGKSVTKDLVQALAWTIKAETGGLADAKQNHVVFEREMTPEQIAAAYKLAGITPQTK
ncbi:MAG: sel1 repeat family protein [Geobacteraceae bacterium]|nr:sel1 repeat family protein [Geobacteraceae bacterium]